MNRQRAQQERYTARLEELQSNMLFAAGSYPLSFDLIGSQRGNTAATTVTFGNNQTFTLASLDVTTGIVSNQLVTLSSPAHLSFVSDTPGDEGNLLDNVVVSTSASSAPEPSSLLLMGSALLTGSIATARRRSSIARSISAAYSIDSRA